MSENLGESVLDLRTDQTALDSGLDQAKGKVEAWSQNLMAGGAALTAIGAPFAVLAHQAIESGDNLLAMSEKVGISVERLSGWSLGLTQSNTSLDSLQLGLKKFAETAEGPLDAALMKVADDFAAMPDGAGKAKMAVELFGRSGMELIPFLNKGSKGIKDMEAESGRLGATMSTKAAKAADGFNDSMAKVNAAIGGMFTKLVDSGLIEKVTQFAERVADVTGEFATAHPELSTFIITAGLMAAALGPLLIAVGAIGLAIGALSTPILAVFGAGAAIAIAIAALGTFTTETDTVRILISEAWDRIKTTISVALAAIKLVWTTWTAFLTGDWKAFGDGISTAWKALWETITGVISRPIQAIKDQVRGLTDGVTGFFSGMYDKVVGHSFVPDMMRGIESEFGRLPAIMESPVRSATSSVLGSFEGMLGGVIDNFTKKIPVIGGLVGDLAKNLSGDLLSSGLNKVLGGTGIGNMLGLGSKVAGGAVKAGSKAASGAASAGLDIASGGLSALASGVGSFAGTALAGLLKPSKDKQIEENTRRTHILLTDLIDQIMWPIHDWTGWIAEQATTLGIHLIPAIEYWNNEVRLAVVASQESLAAAVNVSSERSAVRVTSAVRETGYAVLSQLVASHDLLRRLADSASVNATRPVLTQTSWVQQ